MLRIIVNSHEEQPEGGSVPFFEGLLWGVIVKILCSELRNNWGGIAEDYCYDQNSKLDLPEDFSKLKDLIEYFFLVSLVDEWSHSEINGRLKTSLLLHLCLSIPHSQHWHEVEETDEDDIQSTECIDLDEQTSENNNWCVHGVAQVSQSISEVPPTHWSVDQEFSGESDSFVEFKEISLLVGVLFQVNGCLLEVLHRLLFALLLLISLHEIEVESLHLRLLVFFIWFLVCVFVKDLESCLRICELK